MKHAQAQVAARTVAESVCSLPHLCTHLVAMLCTVHWYKIVIATKVFSTLMLSLLLTDWPPRGVRGGSGRLLLAGLLRVPLLIVPPLPGKVGWGLPDSLGGRLLDVGLYVVLLEGPCDVLPVANIVTAHFLVAWLCWSFLLRIVQGAIWNPCLLEM